jgi:hypothetical protein
MSYSQGVALGWYIWPFQGIVKLGTVPPERLPSLSDLLLFELDQKPCVPLDFVQYNVEKDAVRHIISGRLC